MENIIGHDTPFDDDDFDQQAYDDYIDNKIHKDK